MDLDTLATTVARHPIALWLLGMTAGALLGSGALVVLKTLRHRPRLCGICFTPPAPPL